MEIDIQEVPESEGVVILHFSGDLTSECVRRINECFSAVGKKGKTYAIANMAEVTLISSAVLGEFMGCRKRLIEEHGDLVFCGLDLEMRTKLHLMGATKIFRIYTDIRTALNSYKWEIERQPEKFHVSFPPYLKIVPPLRQLVSRIARQKGYGNRDSFRIETIVDEICNNAVEHGRPKADDLIDLTVIIDPDKIEIDVRNMSDPDKVASLTAMLLPEKTDTDKPKPDVKRGRGLSLIKMLSDGMSVECTDRGTSVRVKKVREE
ncbi:MAG: ATP-binding protein [Chitinispirillaceae bacterium]|nr:ATP-binding protein [Chitinispirillaceae bacterium]